MTSPSDIAARAKEMLDGLAGVTPGSWTRSGVQVKRLDQHGPFLAAGPDGAHLFFSPIGKTGKDQATCIRDLNHVARCGPDDIRPILEAATRISTLEAENARLREQIKVKNEALEPFAAFEEKAKRFVQGRADFGGSPVMPTKHFRLADFERARSALSEGEG